ncbi:hypothetical protein GCM10009792_24320 [Microcella alkalica]|uniref:Uncharacterized protein n=1 Tax=Microcella alkalica TaxID=355930 RepID=A0A839EAX1_9MICO|nr:hypothetical protein [Microcella alkalica]MBA8848376.1 hypothetical protein [Microcella alkalica]
MNLTSYVLDASVALAALSRDIEGAARSGGAFVPVRTCDGIERSVLITPSLLVEIEPLELADEVEGQPASAGEVGTGDWETHSGELATFSGLERYEARNPSYFSW